MTFKAGVSGNPGGKPVEGKIWREAIQRALKRRETGEDKQALEYLADALLDQCLKGDVAALKELGDRLDGKAKETVDMNIKTPQAVVRPIEVVTIEHEPKVVADEQDQNRAIN